MIHYNAVMPQQVFPPRLYCCFFVFHPESFELFDIRLCLNAVQVFVQAIHKKLAELVTVVLIRVVELRREARDSLLQVSRRKYAVIAIPHLP
jgi:hypothetical protein